MNKFSIILVVFAATFFIAGRACAYNYYSHHYGYFDNYYFGLNAGVADTNPDGVPSISGGTFNLTYGKNYRNNFNDFVVGAGVILGYSSNGSYTIDNFDGRGDNAKAYINSLYYGGFLKGGYAFDNIMPFIKLGIVGYSFGATCTYYGPYGDLYETYSTPLSTEGGLLYGIGVEYMLNRNWGVTAQYFGAALSGGDEVDNFTIGADFNF
jgi:hypothetical protein